MDIFKVNGFWKDDGREFRDYLISESPDVPQGYKEEDFFFFGLSEKEIIESSEAHSALEFVITHHEKL